VDASGITIDVDAAGYGWFVDGTPNQDEEFEPSTTSDEALLALTASDAAERMDLLTVLRHEFGHVLGFEDLDPAVHDEELMSATLTAGTRRLLVASEDLVMVNTELTVSEDTETEPETESAAVLVFDDIAGVFAHRPTPPTSGVPRGYLLDRAAFAATVPATTPPSVDTAGEEKAEVQEHPQPPMSPARQSALAGLAEPNTSSWTRLLPRLLARLGWGRQG
jgi:hypothetical protein